MTETRSEYRKKQEKDKNKRFFKQIKSAFSDNDDLDVNPDFTRDRRPEYRTLTDDGEATLESKKETKLVLTSEEKAARLKKKLNHAIILVIVLIILVLLALFYL